MSGWNPPVIMLRPACASSRYGYLKPSLQSALTALGYSFGHAEENPTARPHTTFERETPALEPGEWIVQALRVTN
jgi:hypothetical protein